MNIKLIRLLSVLCAILLAVIAGEWFYAKQAQKKTLAALKVADKKPAKISEMPTIALTKRPEQSFVSMVDRPLFIKGRRPVPEAPADIKKAVAKPSGPFSWQLNGVYTKNSSLYALLSRSVRLPKGNFKKLTQGAEIDGWTLTQVQKDKVVLTQDGMQKELLLRKAKPKTPKPIPPTDPNSQGQPGEQQQQQQDQQMRQPNQPMAEPLPNGEPVPVPEPQNPVDPNAMPDASVDPNAMPDEGMDPNAMPDAGVDPMQEDPGQEFTPDFQTDEVPPDDTSTFDNGTNEQI